MHVFWRKGFEQTSYEDLIRGTGVSRKGLYASFGNKHALFLLALDRYRSTVVGEILGDLGEEATVDGVVRLVERVAATARSDAGRIGCLIANTASTSAIGDADVAGRVRSHLSATSEQFRAVLDRSGIEVGRSSVLADHLTGLLQALFLLARAGVPQAMIDNVAREGLRALRS